MRRVWLFIVEEGGGAGAPLLALGEFKRVDAARDVSHRREIYECAHGPAGIVHLVVLVRNRSSGGR